MVEFKEGDEVKIDCRSCDSRDACGAHVLNGENATIDHILENNPKFAINTGDFFLYLSKSCFAKEQGFSASVIKDLFGKKK